MSQFKDESHESHMRMLPAIFTSIQVVIASNEQLQPRPKQRANQSNIHKTNSKNRVKETDQIRTRMAPPSQAGRFKPRKPARRIRPGAAAGAPAAAPPPVPSSAAAAAANQGGGRGRGDRGGRGGGRGRGRFVIQQGQAFFAGNQPTSAAASARGGSVKGGGLAAAVARRLQQGGSGGGVGVGGANTGGAVGGSLVKREENEHAIQEEIVGMMDEGVGGSLQPDNAKSSKLLSSGPDSQFNNQDEEPLTAPPPSAFEYDSDSSLEMDIPRNASGVVMPSKKPLTLPFPKAKYPPGVGAPIVLGDQAVAAGGGGSRTSTRGKSSRATTDDGDNDEDTMMLDGTPVSPFVSPGSTDDLEEEQESWFLLQLPTRLPPLAGTTSTTDASGPDSHQQQSEQQQQAVDMFTSDVSTAPLRRDCFDNALVRANAGRIGKFIVYDNGKTVLVLDGHDGTQYQLDVTEGLSCSFRQQAVVIDNESKEFIPLGDISKTIVVTPDVETAFVTSR